MTAEAAFAPGEWTVVLEGPPAGHGSFRGCVARMPVRLLARALGA